MCLSASEPQKQQAANQWMNTLIIYRRMGQVHIVKQLQQWRHAQNIKAVIKHGTGETSPLSQMYLLPEPRVNELLQWQL